MLTFIMAIMFYNIIVEKHREVPGEAWWIFIVSICADVGIIAILCNSPSFKSIL